VPTFTDLARAAYCPRQLYYARRDGDRSPPPETARRIELAFRYPELREAAAETLAALPVDLEPAAYREAIDRLALRDDWSELADPAARDVLLEGRDCRGIAHKILERGENEDLDPGGSDDPPVPVVVSPGTPPERGVWKPQSVRAVAAAKALSWERQREIPFALVEYPALADVREVQVTVRRSAEYRAALRTVRSLDGPPPRLRSDAKCGPCEYRAECGAKSRSLRSLLGL
jgi:CRISPR-associated exonuclease Cas4